MHTIRKILVILILIVVIFPVTAWQGREKDGHSHIPPRIITDDEYQLIGDLLLRAGLHKEALDFEKDWSLSTEFKIAGIVEIINNPLQFPRFADKVKAIIKDRDLNHLSNYLADVIFADIVQIAEPETVDNVESKSYFEDYFEANVRQPQHLIDYAEHLFTLADEHYQKAAEALTPDDKQILTYLSYSMWSDTDDRERYMEKLPFWEEYKENFEDLKMDDYRKTILKIDWRSFLNAKKVFLNGAEVLQEKAAKMDFNNRQTYSRDTRWGRFVVGTSDNNTYLSDEERIAFLVEPGGDNIYKCDFAACFDYPFYLVLDLAGDDIYRNDTIGGLFRVSGGIGWSANLSGRNIYEADDLAFSSFVGFQYHHSGPGNDYYNTGRFSQAAAAFGVSIITNEGGNNIYSTTGYGQGFGGTLGAGILIDHEGNDVYYAGGKYSHAPLRPEDHRSMAQGFGFGVRPDWGGGFGILYDGKGNDTYTGSVYAQAAGYWYGLGMLLDGGGNDTFRAVQYSQGSGIHLAGGLLYNKSGDNSYYSRFGPGQGAGHDYAIGFLIDRAGDDHYSIDGGNGLGLTNSVGIFLDVEGDDRYERVRNTNYGYANQARDSGGIGIFLDTGGEDVYSDTLQANNDFWVRGTYGIGLDTCLVKVDEEIDEEEEPDIDEELAEIEELTDVSELFSIASEWEVGTSIERVRRARKRIMEFEKEAAQYIYENKLDSQRGLEHRAILAFARESEVFPDYLEKGLAHEDSLVVKNSISFAANLEKEGLVHYLEDFLERRKYVPTTIMALANFKTDESVELLMPFVDSASERKRVLTARSLKAIDIEKSREVLRQMIDDESFLVQTVVRLTFPDEYGLH